MKMTKKQIKDVLSGLKPLLEKFGYALKPLNKHVDGYGWSATKGLIRLEFWYHDEQGFGPPPGWCWSAANAETEEPMIMPQIIYGDASKMMLLATVICAGAVELS